MTETSFGPDGVPDGTTRLWNPISPLDTARYGQTSDRGSAKRRPRLAVIGPVGLSIWILGWLFVRGDGILGQYVDPALGWSVTLVLPAGSVSVEERLP